VNDAATSPRPLTAIERAVIERLLDVPFPGRDQLRAQLPFASVDGGCRCGCATITLTVDRASAVAAPVGCTTPVSADIRAEGLDAGIVLLVDGDGFLTCLEVYSIGDEPVRRWPPIDTIHPRPGL